MVPGRTPRDNALSELSNHSVSDGLIDVSLVHGSWSVFRALDTGLIGYLSVITIAAIAWHD